MTTTVWVRSPRVLWRPVADGVLLLAPDAADPMLVTGSGAAMWELLECPLDGEELASRLAQRFDTTADQIKAESAPFLAKLAVAGVLMRAP